MIEKTHKLGLLHDPQTALHLHFLQPTQKVPSKLESNLLYHHTPLQPTPPDDLLHLPKLPTITSKLISTFYTNYIASNPSQPIATIDPSWFNPFSSSNISEPPPWSQNHLLITALRAPYVVTRNLDYLPKNALGWSCYLEDVGSKELGNFSKYTACSQLYLYPLSTPELQDLQFCIKSCFWRNKNEPWKVIFFTKQNENKSVNKFNGTFYTNIAHFIDKSGTSFYLHSIENQLSKTLDPPMHKKLHSWMKQFPKSKIFSNPAPHHTPRRSIQSYFQANLPAKSTILSQPYMQYFLPQPTNQKPDIDPTLPLLGYQKSSASFTWHKTEVTNNNKFLSELFHNSCLKYKDFKRSLKKTQIKSNPKE